MDPLIKAEKIRVVFNKGKSNEYVGLNDVSVEIYPEEYIILFGPSGCGKSTFLYTILGLQPFISGKLLIHGKNFSAFSEKEKTDVLSKFYGIVFQQYNLIFSLNVTDNVVLPQIFMGESIKSRRPKGMALLKRFGIEAQANRLPGMLSGGQQQRVAICRALINDPQVLLADEPVGNLDSESAAVVMETINEINKRDKKTIILVTHDTRYLTYADRIYFFKDAKVEKVVVNKEKEGAKKEMTPAAAAASDLETLARAYSFMTSEQLKALVLTNWLTQELTMEQTRRLEKVIGDLLGGKISENDFFDILDKPFTEGGVGLYRVTAIKYTMKISRVLREVRIYLDSLENIGSPGVEDNLKNILAQFLLEEYEGELNSSQTERLKKSISDRVFRKLSREDFRAVLDRPTEDGGVGLVIATAQRLAEKLEIILAQSA